MCVRKQFNDNIRECSRTSTLPKEHIHEIKIKFEKKKRIYLFNLVSVPFSFARLLSKQLRIGVIKIFHSSLFFQITICVFFFSLKFDSRIYFASKRQEVFLANSTVIKQIRPLIMCKNI